MRALEKDRNRRYETANGLARDVQRYLSGDAVEACPPTWGYRLRKVYRKNRAAVWTGGLFAAVLLAATAVSVAFAVAATRAEGLAERRREEADDARKVAVVNETKARGSEARAVRAREELAGTLYASRSRLIQAAWDAHDIDRVRVLLREQAPAATERDLRHFEWHYYDRLAHAELSVTAPDPAYAGKNGLRILLSPDGSSLAIFQPADPADAIQTGFLARIDVRDAVSGKLRSTMTVARPVRPRKESLEIDVRFTQDGTGISVWEHAIRTYQQIHPLPSDFWLFDVATGAERYPRRELPLGVVGTNPDGTLLVAMFATEPSRGPYRLTVIDGNTLQRGKTFETDLPAYFYGFGFPAGGRYVALMTDLPALPGVEEVVKFDPLQPGRVKSLLVWDVTTGKEVVAIIPRGPNYSRDFRTFGFSRDGKRLFVLDPTLRVLDVGSGRELFAPRIPADYWVVSAADHDGSRVVLSSFDTPVQTVFDAQTGQVRSRLKYPCTYKEAVAFSADGKRLVTTSPNGTVRVWDAMASEIPAEEEDRVGSQLTRHRSRRVSPDGRYAVTWSRLEEERPAVGVVPAGVHVRVVESASRREVWTTFTKGWAEAAFHVTPDGTRLIGILSPWTMPLIEKVPIGLRVWDLRTGRELFARDYPEWDLGECGYSALHPDGTRVACGGSRGEKGGEVGIVRILDVTSGRVLATMEETAPPVSAVEYDPSGTRLAVAFDSISFGRLVPGHEVGLWDPETGRKLTGLATQLYRPDRLEFSADGRQLRVFANGRSRNPANKATVRLVNTFDATPRPEGKAP